MMNASLAVVGIFSGWLVALIGLQMIRLMNDRQEKARVARITIPSDDETLIHRKER